MVDSLPVTSQMVIAVPDIGVHERSSNDRLILLACDGLWDVVKNEESTMFAHELLDSMGVYKGNSAASSTSTSTNTSTNIASIGVDTSKGSKKRARVEDSDDDSNNSSNSKKKMLGKGTVLTAAKVIVDVALKAGSYDNISVLLSTLPQPTLPQPKW